MTLSQPASSTRAASGADGPVRLLVVDDSAVIRGLLKRILETDPDIDVVGSAPNGQAAIDFVERHPVDVVVLDIEMPVMNGLDALPLIIQARPGIRVIMASTLTRRGAAISIEALSKGASDFVPKPSATKELGRDQDFGRDLREKIRALSGRPAGAAPARAGAAPTKAGTVRPATSSLLHAGAEIVLRQASVVSPRVLAIGSSTGGPQALFDVLGDLAKDVEIPIVITQHMPATFTAILAEHISRASGRECVEGTDGAPVLDGGIYLAPGDFHMTVSCEGTAPTIQLDQKPAENFCRPSVDPLFRSVSKCYGAATLALVLTGMGHDGLAGAQEIVGGGGTVVAQDEATSVVWGMPGAVATGGVCSAVLPLNKISSHLKVLIKGGRR